MNFIIAGAKPNGLYYNGKLYGGISSEIKIVHKNILNVDYKIEASAGSEYTTGYPVTLSYSAEQFELLNRKTLERYTYLPEYKFVLYNVVETEIPELSLVYDGDGLFHIEGDVSAYKYYTSGKTLTSIILALVDENNELFVSLTSGILKTQINSTSESVSFIDTTATFGKKQIIRESTESISLPFDLSAYSDSLPSIYATHSYSISIALPNYKHEIL